MVGKLMGFEFRSSLKYLGAIWAALLVTSVLVGFSNRFLLNSVNTGQFGNLLGICMTGLFVITFIAMVVATIFIVIVRFYKGLLGEEGYLMHTLPVKEWQLITSKGLCAAAIVVISIIAGTFSIMLSISVSDPNGGFFEWVIDVFRLAAQYPGSFVLLAEGLIVAIAGIVSSVYHVYASLAIGQLVNKYRILLAIAAYIGIEFVLSIAEMGLIMAAGNMDLSLVVDENIFRSTEAFSQMVSDVQPYIIAVFAAVAVQIAIFHVVTERLLSKKLNLQ